MCCQCSTISRSTSAPPSSSGLAGTCCWRRADPRNLVNLDTCPLSKVRRRHASAASASSYIFLASNSPPTRPCGVCSTPPPHAPPRGARIGSVARPRFVRRRRQTCGLVVCLLSLFCPIKISPPPSPTPHSGWLQVCKHVSLPRNPAYTQQFSRDLPECRRQL